MNLQTITIKGIFLGTILILLFFLVYFFGFNENYFKYNLIVICFIIPVIIMVFLLYELIQLKKTFKEKLSFFTYFKYTYLIQVISNILSIGFIYIFMNTIDIEARNIFNYQRADINYKNARIQIEEGVDFPNLNEEQNIKQSKLTLNSLKSIRDHNSVNFFSFTETLFVAFVFGVNIYCIFLSLSLSLFIRNQSFI